MDFEFDPAKSDANLRKHGIDFLVVGLLRGRHWSAVITYRQQTIRLISVRRSRPEVVQLYEQL